MGWKAKVPFLALGIALILAGLGAWNKDFNNLIVPVLLIAASAILLTQVGFKKLFNKQYSSSDVTDAIQLVLGVTVLISGILSFFAIPLSLFWAPIAALAVAVVGLTITIQSFWL
ncbi:hypothetical protein KKG81_04485 [bacterium]|nr:hypothetical protein [bacterium]